ncbi:MAG: hypothetical protein JW734_10255 [Candidatus Omnitrophica bacterium]|nr:hypothetical protein [Candidatus Omnitrophota bacterium]
MIRINLLPPEYKKRLNILPYLTEFLPYVFLLVLLFLLLNLVFGFLSTNRLVALKGTESAWDKRQPEFKEITALKEEVAKLRRDYDSLSQLGYSKAYFSEVMYLLHTSLPVNIWFRQIDYQGGVLNVTAGALDFDADASLSLRKYLDTLRNSAITKRFPSIEIASQEMRRIKDKSVLYFVLELKDVEK